MDSRIILHFGPAHRTFEGKRPRTDCVSGDWQENLRRNAERGEAVPEHAIENMLGKLVQPQRWEAQAVDWRCV